VIVVRFWIRRTAVAVAVAGAVLGSVAVTSADALSPWWHLSSASRPTVLNPAQGKDEVQQVVVSATGGEFTLTEAETSKSTHLDFDATAGEVQQGLEAVYGAGNVEVPRGRGNEAGSEPYEVIFKGGLAHRPIPPIEATSGSLQGGRQEANVSELTRGSFDGQVVVTAVNLGDASASPEVQPIVLTDSLPAGVQAVSVEAYADERITAEKESPLECTIEGTQGVRCTYTGVGDEEKVVTPYNQIQVRIGVDLRGDAKSGEVNEAAIDGGGAPSLTARQSLQIGDTPVPFGASVYEMRAEEAGGGVATQAGSHPFQLTTTLDLNESIGYTRFGVAAGKPIALTKDLRFQLPPGLIGNPTPFAQCSLARFLTEGEQENECPAQTVVGVARVDIAVPGQFSGTVEPFEVPLFNLEPSVGEPARFGFLVHRTPVLLDTSVRTGGDYGVTVSVTNISQTAEFITSEVTFWGVGGGARHDGERNWNCLGSELAARGESPYCHRLGELHPAPLLALPTSCNGPLQTTVEADSWKEPLNVLSLPATAPLPAMDGCNRLPFEPSIKVTPDGQAGSTPTGLDVDVHVNQESVTSGSGLAESDVRGITVALPEGVAIDPAGGDGLQACPESLVGFEGVRGLASEPGVQNTIFSPQLPQPLQAGSNFCADASKIGTVAIHTPLLAHALEGSVYLASQESNPFGTLVAMYIVAQDPVSGTLVKLPGAVHLTASGQIVATFENNPQLPFEDAELHFFGGERAPLASPSRCGTYTTSASYTPWSGNESIGASSSFEIKTGPNGSACPGASLPFSPSLTAGTTSIQAGGFSPFTLTMSREDGQQSLQAISLHMPAGLSGLLAGVELCREPQADQGTCGPNSLIGETTVSVGLGGDPFTVTGGKVYITGPYEGAPFGLSIVNPAKAGPFDLEDTQANHPPCDCLVVRATIEVDPSTAALTITSDNSGPYRIPTILEGIPLQIKHVNVTVARPGFIFNPTDCDKTQITGSLTSAEGASQALAVPFQATNCAVLGFAPKFAVSTSGKTSRANGASLSVKLTYPSAPFGSQANVRQVKVELPKRLPSRLSTLQKACTAAQFRVNPAGCPAQSVVGHAKAITPLVPVPLEGPAYFVSNGGEAFPNLILVLQGYGVTIDLVGDTFISKAGITSSTFKTVPDAPVGSFELTLPEGPYSALAANGNLCKDKLTMPTEFLAQNGAAVHRSTKIAVSGCPKAKRAAQRVKKRRKDEKLSRKGKRSRARRGGSAGTKA
jgi:hypothetical protein